MNYNRLWKWLSSLFVNPHDDWIARALHVFCPMLDPVVNGEDVYHRFGPPLLLPLGDDGFELTFFTG